MDEGGSYLSHHHWVCLHSHDRHQSGWFGGHGLRVPSSAPNVLAGQDPQAVRPTHSHGLTCGVSVFSTNALWEQRWEQRTSPYPIVNSTLSARKGVADIRQPLLPLWITPTGSAT